MKNFTIIPNQTFEQTQLSVPARYLYCVLLKFCGKDDFCFPSQITLGKILGYSDKHIRTLLDELIESRLVSKKRRGWNRSNTYYVVKLLDTKRIPTSATDKKSISTPIQTSDTSHSGSTVPIHNETPVPSINTYLKGKDKNSLKGLESMREILIAKGVLKPTTTVVKPSNDYQKLSNK